ncbi:MAG: PorT family protein [Bacteroidales bacterium]|nr:PorT family protein [Bacteroidales bacterium]
MKKLLLLGFVIILTAPVFSQIKFGIKAGGETTTVPSYQLGNGAATINALKDASWGYHAGIFLRFGLGPVYLQPEAVFASTSFDYNVTTVNMTALRTQKFNRISIPVLLGLKLGPLRINAGPAASVMIGSPSALINDPDFENMYRRTVYGYQAGLGIDLGPLTLDVRYAGSLGENMVIRSTLAGRLLNLIMDNLHYC